MYAFILILQLVSPSMQTTFTVDVFNSVAKCHAAATELRTQTQALEEEDGVSTRVYCKKVFTGKVKA